MGTKGTEIVGLDVQELIADLNRAYADEWLAFYAYTHMAQVVTGRPAAKHLAELLHETAAEELEHQDELAERIASLGGEPLADPMKLVEASNEGYPTPPADATGRADGHRVLPPSAARSERCRPGGGRRIAGFDRSGDGKLAGRRAGCRSLPRPLRRGPPTDRPQRQPGHPRGMLARRSGPGHGRRANARLIAAVPLGRRPRLPPGPCVATGHLARVT